MFGPSKAFYRYKLMYICKNQAGNFSTPSKQLTFNCDFSVILFFSLDKQPTDKL